MTSFLCCSTCVQDTSRPKNKLSLLWHFFLANVVSVYPFFVEESNEIQQTVAF